jgi:uncharacterized protein YcgL (UPF0745 family)
MVPLPETVLKIVFQNTSHQRLHVALDVRKVSKSLSLQGIFLILERAKNRRGLIQVTKVDGPFL